MRSQCTIPGCDKPIQGRGWCSKHFMRWWRRGGDPSIDARSAPRYSCAIPGCEKPQKARDWCAKHYQRWLRYGDPTQLLKFQNTDPATRFWAKVEKTNNCWLWLGYRQKLGYGTFSDHSRHLMLAHRFAYELLVNAIPEGLTLDHLCRVRHCVNPEHLEPVPLEVNIHRGMSARRNRSTCS